MLSSNSIFQKEKSSAEGVRVGSMLCSGNGKTRVTQAWASVRGMCWVRPGSLVEAHHAGPGLPWEGFRCPPEPKWEAITEFKVGRGLTRWMGHVIKFGF